MINRLRETWNTGKPALNGWLAIPSTFSAEIMSHQNFDSITIDLQHGLTDYSIAVPMCRLCQRVMQRCSAECLG